MIPRTSPRVRKARRLRALASGFSLAGDEARARQLRRKALAYVDPDASDPAWTVEPDVRKVVEDIRALAISRSLDRRLAGVWSWSWLIKRWRRIAAVAGGVVVALGVLVAAVAPVRRALFPPDLAAGKHWSASSALIGWPGAGILHGDAGDQCCLFHTNEEPSPSFTLDLAKVLRVRRVEVSNRADCCVERALPLVVELSKDGRDFKRVAYRRGEFQHWSARFPESDARFIRLRVDRSSILHLRQIAVY